MYMSRLTYSRCRVFPYIYIYIYIHIYITYTSHPYHSKLPSAASKVLPPVQSSKHQGVRHVEWDTNVPTDVKEGQREAIAEQRKARATDGKIDEIERLPDRYLPF